MNVTITEIEVEYGENEMNALANSGVNVKAFKNAQTPGEIQELLANVNVALRNDDLDTDVRVELLKIRKKLKQMIEGIHKVEY